MCLKDTCVICLEDAKFRRLGPSRALAIQKIRNNANLPDMGERLKCGHIFHRKCILPWFLNLESEGSYNCPMCRGEIVFSNNLGMRNDFLFERKYDLEDKKAREEGYYEEEDYDEEEDEEDYDDDEEEQDEEDYDDDEDEEDEEEEDDYSSEDERDLAENVWNPAHDLRYYLTHEGEVDDLQADDNPDFLNERANFDQENERRQMRNAYSCYRFSYRCESQISQNELRYLSQPKLEKYAFRPHPCSFVH